MKSKSKIGASRAGRIAAIALIALTALPAGSALACVRPQSVVYSFEGGDDGIDSRAPLLNVGGTLYGTTVRGGTYGHGTVFAVTRQGVERVVYSFTGGADGDVPFAGLTNVGGTLYGTASFGGEHGLGTLFSVTPAGELTVLHSFTGGRDGAYPRELSAVNGVIWGVAPNIVSTTGESTGNGSVFKLTPGGGFRVVYHFKGGEDGAHPVGPLINVAGTLYGATSYDGAYGAGTVFSLTRAGVKTTLHTFTGGSDGGQPYSSPTLMNGMLYGTAHQGGSGSCTYQCGTVWRMTPTGGDFTVLHTFGSSGDGDSPIGHLLKVGDKLYGTTFRGGTGRGCYDGTCGTVYSMTADGDVKIRWSLRGGSAGGNPWGGLINVAGTLYGTTAGSYGGSYGTVYKIVP